MCHCISDMSIEIKWRFGEDIYQAGCITNQFPKSGKGLDSKLSSRVLIRVKRGNSKYMNIPALFCPFCGEKYNEEEPSTVQQSIRYAQIKKGDEVTRLPR